MTAPYPAPSSSGGSPRPSDLALARTGDRAALDRLLARIQDRLLALTESRLGPRLRTKVRVSDILQSTYLQVLRSIDRFDSDSEEAFIAWTARILVNNIRRNGRFFTARKREASRELLSSPARLESELRSFQTPSGELSRREGFLLVSRALDNLSEDHRQVLLLRVERHSHREIAQLLGRSEAAARMLLSRARAALSLELERLERTAPPGPPDP